jgi:NADPH-dependent 2,4-dienoyl-CoA reductase/sulfur reductase-like enzyme
MHVAILGNGVAGVTAALRLRQKRPDWRITLISGESTYHYSRPALMYVFMGHLRYEDTKPFEDAYWAEQRLDLVRDWVVALDVAKRRLLLHRGTPIHFDQLLIATGSKPNRFGWPGQDLDGVQGLWGLYDLKLLYRNAERARRAAIVGGGLIGIELAEMLHSRGLPVTLLVREDTYWGDVLPAEESGLVNEVIRAAGMDLRLRTELERIEDDGGGRAGAVVTKAGERIDCQLVGLTAGVSPNIDLLKDTPIATGRGVLVDRSLRTNVPGIFAAGDCAEIVDKAGGRNTINQVWYTGKMQGEVAADALAGEAREYRPGVWFNSAKFLDLEYQVYGKVGYRLPGEESLFWRHPDERRSIRIVHRGGRVAGFNLMGVRWRHAVCERWLAAAATVDHVLDHLEEASFDPELHARCEAAARDAFRSAVR